MQSRRDHFISLSLLSMGALCGGTSSPASSTRKRIDRRTRSESRAHGLIFAAKNIDEEWTVGHAFVVWQRENDDAQLSTSSAIGFWPQEGADKLQVALGGPGVLRSDHYTDVDLGLTVLVNSDAFAAAEARRQQWQHDGRYDLLWQNCVAHVGDIARTIGLTVPKTQWVFPQDFVRDLINAND
jgi:hypothetical protein